MPDSLSTEQIRRLIFKIKWGGGMFSDLARWIGDEAFKDGLLQQRPDFSYGTHQTLGENILEVVWGLIIEGVYTPGISVQHPGFPGLRLTEYGGKCFEAGELTPHDPDGYLKRLKTVCPNIDATTMLYVEEALGSFRSGRFLASAVMIGVASESMLLRLVDAVRGALNPADQTSFDQATKRNKAKTYHDEVMKVLNRPTVNLPSAIKGDDLSVFVSGIFNLIRQTRNVAGHPTGRRMDRDEANALLLQFPSYCERVEKLIAWLKANPI
jgi:hypothetical protein